MSATVRIATPPSRCGGYASVVGSGWPLTGRVEELRVVTEIIRSPGAGGLVLAGAPGVGKTRLAREALGAAALRGLPVRLVVGTVSAQSVPLGAFAEYATRLGPDPLARVRDVVEALTRTAGADPVVVAIDERTLLPPRDRVEMVGYVGQDPSAGFVSDTVEEELAYGMEQLGLPPARCAAGSRRRSTCSASRTCADATCAPSPAVSSNGWRSGRCSTMHPRVLVLDEPTSALDPTAAEEVLATLARLVHDVGVAVVVAEHRLERVVPFADTMVLVTGHGARVAVASRRDAAHLAGRTTDRRARPLAGWTPLPLSVREAAAVRPLGAARCAAAPPARQGHRRPGRTRSPTASAWPMAPVAASRRRRHAARRLGDRADGPQRGRKSTLLWALQGSGRRDAGRVDVAGADPAASADQRRDASVWCRRRRPTCSTWTPSPRSAPPPTARPVSTTDLPGRCSTGSPPASIPAPTPATCPRASGWRSSSRCVLVARPPVLLLDEPTRGLDYPAKRPSASILAGLAADGTAVLRRHPRRRVRGRRRASGSSCSPRARWSPTDRPPTVLGESPVLRAPGRRRCSARPGSPSTQVARRAGGGGRRGRIARRRAVPALRPRSFAVLGARVRRRPDDVRLAAARPGRPGTPRVDPPFLFLALLPVLIAVVLAEFSEGGMDAKVLAMLGVLTAINAVLRGSVPGTAGIELVFFLLILAGRVFGPGLRVRAGLHVAVRLRAAHRRASGRGCRSRCSPPPGSAGRRAAAAPARAAAPRSRC